jgi:hypothetical protein
LRLQPEKVKSGESAVPLQVSSQKSIAAPAQGGPMDKLRELARGALVIMVLDLEYDNDLEPTHGHTPIRHQLLWGAIEEALGKDAMLATVDRLCSEAKKGNWPVKTNPWKDRSYAERIAKEMDS